MDGDKIREKGEEKDKKKKKVFLRDCDEMKSLRVVGTWKSGISMNLQRAEVTGWHDAVLF